MKPIKIKCAAIRNPETGIVYEGTSHYKIGTQMIKDGACYPPYPGGVNQGFVTSDGMFVSRAAAMYIAAKAGQVIQGKTIHRTDLFSEDLRK
jgi:hypothetical protein